jgi:hypothetical protein
MGRASAATRQRPARIAGVAAAASIFLAVYLLRLDPIAGLFVDDAWYALLAQALATGHGYHLINSPVPAIQPVYPPFFPFLLSLAYRLRPQFPDNLWLLKAVSVAAMAGLGWASFRHFTSHRQWPAPLALLSAGAVTMVPALVFLATSSLMSECAFALLQVSAVVAIEAAARAADARRGRRALLVGAALAATACLTRAIGWGLIVAGVGYLAIRRGWRAAVLFAVTVSAIAGPPTIYLRRHAPTAEQRQAHGGNIVQDYATQFWQRRAGQASSGATPVRELPARLWSNLRGIAGADAAMLFTPIWFRAPKLSGIEAVASGVSPKRLSYLLSLLVVIGFVWSLRRRLMCADLVVLVTILITVAWPWNTFRFLLPLAPFLFGYAIDSGRALHHAVRRWHVPLRAEPWPALTMLAGGLLSLYLIDHAAYLHTRGDLSPAEYLPWRAIYEEQHAVLDWIRDATAADAVVASENPALVYLYTGRQSVAIDDPAGNWERWKRLNVRYMARLPLYPLAQPGPNEGRFPVAFRSSGPLKLRVIDLGPPEHRLPWLSFRSGRPPG